MSTIHRWLKGIDSSVHLGSLYGIPLRLHYSWFLVFALVTVFLASAFPSGYRPWERIFGGAVTSIFFFASVIAHELAHSIIAVKSGIPVKSITLYVFGGLSQITKEASKPSTELAMAAAGPLSSFVISAIFFGLVFIIQSGEVPGIFSSLVSWLAWINLLLALFNMIPGFPLDGGRILRAILWRIKGSFKKATRTAALVGRGIAYSFMFGGLAFSIIGLVFTAARWFNGNPQNGNMVNSGFITSISSNWFNGLLLALIGWFIGQGASYGYQQVFIRETLKGFKAVDVISPECHQVLPSSTLSQLVRDHVLPQGQASFLVVAEGLLVGMVTMQNIRNVPRQNWETTRTEDVMVPLRLLTTASPQQDILSVLDLMANEGVDQLPVVQDGKAMGIIARDNLLRFARVRSELGV